MPKATLSCGDALSMLRCLPTASVQCYITSTRIEEIPHA